MRETNFNLRAGNVKLRTLSYVQVIRNQKSSNQKLRWSHLTTGVRMSSYSQTLRQTGFKVEWSRDAPVDSCRLDHRSYYCVKIEDYSGKLIGEFEQHYCFESQRSQELTDLNPEKTYTAEVKAKTFVAGSYTQSVYSDPILLISNTRLLLVGTEERATDVSAKFTFPLSALQLHSGVPQFFIA